MKGILKFGHNKYRKIWIICISMITMLILCPNVMFALELNERYCEILYQNKFPTGTNADLTEVEHELFYFYGRNEKLKYALNEGMEYIHNSDTTINTHASYRIALDNLLSSEFNGDIGCRVNRNCSISSGPVVMLDFRYKDSDKTPTEDGTLKTGIYKFEFDFVLDSANLTSNGIRVEANCKHGNCGNSFAWIMNNAWHILAGGNTWSYTENNIPITNDELHHYEIIFDLDNDVVYTYMDNVKHKNTTYRGNINFLHLTMGGKIKYLDNIMFGKVASYGYKYDEETKTLYFDSSGEMPDYSEDNRPGWYEYKDEIEKLVISDTTIDIGDYAFADCVNLKEIEYGASVQKIGKYAFYGCDGLVEQTVPSTVTEIEDYAFGSCDELNSVVVPTSVGYIGTGIFMDCINLENVSVLTSSETIPAYMFANCTSLTEVELPDGVVRIGHNAFQGCSSLGTIKLPDTLEILEYEVFSGCTGLYEITIPTTVTCIERDVFGETHNVKVNYIDGEKAWSEITKANEDNYYGNINYYVNGKISCNTLDVDRYEDNVIFGYMEFDIVSEDCIAYVEIFDYTSDRTPVLNESFVIELTAGTEYIDFEHWFLGDNKPHLVRVSFYDNETDKNEKGTSVSAEFYADKCLYNYNEYDYYMFSKDTVEFAGFRDFEGERLMVPDTIDDYDVVAIADYAFESVSDSEAVLISESITKIGDYAFENSSIKKIYYLGSKTDWENIDISENNEALENIEIIFEYCDDIVSGYLNTVYYSGYAVTGTVHFDYVYKDCVAVVKVYDRYDRLEKVSYVNVQRGANKKYIGLPLTADDRGHNIKITFVNNASELKEYGECDSEKGYFYAKKIRLYEGEFAYTLIDGKAEILGYEGTDSNIEIPESIAGFTVAGIGDYAFAGYENLDSVILPDTVTYIGECAFAESGVKRIVISASVSEIGIFAFDCCHELTEILIDEDNEYFCSLDGHIYSKDMTKLIRYDITKTETEFVIPDSVATIGIGAFVDAQLKNIIIPESVKVIEEKAFAWSPIERIEIPSSVESIGKYVFVYCNALTDVTVDEENRYYSSEAGVMYNKDKTILVQYPTGREDISYQVPEGVVTIGLGAFINSSLKTLIIPNTLEKIETSAFTECKLLDTVLYYDTEEEYSNIEVSSGNDDFEDANVVFEYNGMPAGIQTVHCLYSDNWISADVNFNYLLENGTIVFAIYDEEGKLVDIQGGAISCNSLELCYEFSVDEGCSDYTVKTMLVENFETMKPLAKAVVADIEEAVFIDEVLESAHPYSNNMNEENIYIYDGECKRIEVTFSNDTITENSYDYITIYDANDNEIDVYEGDELAGKTINIPGNTVKIRLNTDSSQVYYGYRTECIVVYK